MMTSSITRTEAGRIFYERIKEALVECCAKTPSEAERVAREFFSDRQFIEDDELLYTETPYYYAMCIAHHPVLGDNQPEWYLNSRYFPPPEKWKS